MNAEAEKKRIARQIREAYPWMSDDKINYFAELAIKNKYKDGYNRNKDEGAQGE